MGIRLTTSGMHTTVQDEGRNGAQRHGFSVSGVMDRFSFRLANLLVGNDRNEAVLEMTLAGASFEFTTSNSVALTGADCSPRLNGKPVDMCRTLSVEAGDKLTTGAISNGTFSYIAFSGGLDIPEVMGSKATSTRYGIGGFNGRTLKEGDFISFKETGETREIDRSWFGLSMQSRKKHETVKIRVIPSQSSGSFTTDDLKKFFESEFKISSQSDRMGYRLNGPEVKSSEQAVISEGTVLGDVQIPPDGRPIVLLADRQTSGGYPVIGTVCTVDIPKIVQCSSGQKIRFKQTSLEKAQTLLKQQEAFFKTLEKAEVDPNHVEETEKHNIETEEWDLTKIKALINTVGDSSLTTFSYEKDKIRLKMDKRPLEKERNVASTPPEIKQVTEPVRSNVSTIHSTLVGVFYCNIHSDATLLVETGMKVCEGQLLGRIEAMNNSYEIKADKSGVIQTICVSDGQMVEYGQPLMHVLYT